MESGKRGYEAFWKEAVRDISEDLSEQEFSTWFRGIEFGGGGDSQVLISVPSSFIKDQITQRYLTRLEEKLEELSGQKLSIKLSVQKRASARGSHEESGRGQKAEEVSTRKRQHPNLNKEYTFERFIIGESNSFAANASLAISKNPGTG